MTRRWLARMFIVLTIILLLGALPLASFAEKDPFRPLVTQQNSGSASSGVASQPAAPAPAAPGRSLPFTGFDFQAWVIAAASLILAGSTLVLLDRYLARPILPA